MKKFVWPLLIIFFLLGGLAAILIGEIVLPPEPRPETVEAISEKWTESGHADAESESFVHWDEEEVPEVPANCAKCHSGIGYMDFLGEDGSEPLSVDSAAKLGSVVSCFVCHNPTAHEKDTAIYPSGAEITELGDAANCVECHQGRTAGTTVDSRTASLPEDEVNADLSFINVHYKVAGAVRFGSEVTVGYEYPGKTYGGFYPHVSDYQTCTDCHDPHSLELTATECAACHPVVSSLDDLKKIRIGSTPDYDGDGNVTEGVYDEMMAVHEVLYSAIQSYAAEVLDAPVLYAKQFPYWFNDTNGNGEPDEGEVAFPNQFASWSPRLLKAAYNYHLVLEDPGGYMHNASYLVQVMYDSIENLSEKANIDMGNLVRPE